MLASKIEDFPKLWPSKRPSKFHRFWASIFYRFWVHLGLQHGPILGAKTASNSKIGPKNFRMEVHKNGSGYELAFREGSGPSWPRFWGGPGSISGGFWMIFGSFLAYFGHVFGCSCWGGYAPPDPPALVLVFVFLERSSANFVKKSKNLPRTTLRIQEPAEDKAEKKVRTNAYQKTQISKPCSSLLLSLSQRSRLRKHWAAVLPPRGGFNPPPTGDGV